MNQTMKSRLLKLLKRQWVTPYIALREVNCLSLSQRCGELNREYQMVAPGEFVCIHTHRVISKWIKLPNGKRCKAYKIV